MEIRGFDALIAPNGTQALKLLSRERFDLLILHACLPELDGFEVLEALAALHHPCPPRVLFLCEPELCASRPALADAVAPICAAPEKLCALLETLGAKAAAKTGSGSGAAHRAGGGYLFKRHFHGPSLQGPRLCGVAP